MFGFQRGYLLFLSENGTVYEFSTLFYIDFPGQVSYNFLNA